MDLFRVPQLEPGGVDSPNQNECDLEPSFQIQEKYKTNTGDPQVKVVGTSVKDERWSKAGISMRAMDLKIHHSVLGHVSSTVWCV